jgi:hypothetical protein
MRVPVWPSPRNGRIGAEPSTPRHAECLVPGSPRRLTNGGVGSGGAARRKGGAPTVRTRASILVTGASGGIGRAIAEQFARAGTNLVLSARGEATLHEIAADWEARYGVTVTVLPADLSEPGAAAALAGRVVDAGIGIDYLVTTPASAPLACSPRLISTPRSACCASTSRR